MSLEQRLARLEAEVAELRAAQALRTLLSQYAVTVDEQQPAALAALFTPDARVDIPAWSVAVSGREAVMGFYAEYWARFARPRRYFANEQFRIADDRASCFMYWHVTQERNDESVLGWGTYDWAFRRDGRDWRIASVVISIRAMTTLPAGWAGDRQFTDA